MTAGTNLVGGGCDVAQAITASCVASVISGVFAFMLVNKVNSLFGVWCFGLVNSVSFVACLLLTLATVKMARVCGLVGDRVAQPFSLIVPFLSFLISLLAVKMFLGVGFAYLFRMGLFNMLGLIFWSLGVNENNEEGWKRWVAYSFFLTWPARALCRPGNKTKAR